VKGGGGRVRILKLGCMQDRVTLYTGSGGVVVRVAAVVEIEREDREGDQDHLELIGTESLDPETAEGGAGVEVAAGDTEEDQEADIEAEVGEVPGAEILRGKKKGLCMTERRKGENRRGDTGSKKGRGRWRRGGWFTLGEYRRGLLRLISGADSKCLDPSWTSVFTSGTMGTTTALSPSSIRWMHTLPWSMGMMTPACLSWTFALVGGELSVKRNILTLMMWKMVPD